MIHLFFGSLSVDCGTFTGTPVEKSATFATMSLKLVLRRRRLGIVVPLKVPKPTNYKPTQRTTFVSVLKQLHTNPPPVGVAVLSPTSFLAVFEIVDDRVREPQKLTIFLIDTLQVAHQSLSASCTESEM